MMKIETLTKFIGFMGDFRVKTDKKRMQQVLLNVYSNAIKFTPRQGKIVLLIENLNDEKLIRISVTDNGRGIKKNDQS